MCRDGGGNPFAVAESDAGAPASARTTTPSSVGDPADGIPAVGILARPFAVRMREAPRCRA